MKKNRNEPWAQTIKRSFAVLWLIFFCSVSIYAADTDTDTRKTEPNPMTQPPLKFVSQPVARDMDIDSVQIIQFTLKNLVSNQPIFIDEIYLAAASPIVRASFESQCGNTVPAGGTCIVTGRIRSAEKTGSANITIAVTFDKRRITILSNSLELKVAKFPPPVLKFTFQDIPNDMEINTQQVLTYTVINTSTVKATKINSASVTPPSGLVVTSTKVTCLNGIVEPGKKCNIKITIASGNVAGSVISHLVIKYNDNKSTLTSIPLAFNVSLTAPALEFLVESVPSDMFTGESQTLKYTVKNISGNTATFKHLFVNPHSTLVTEHITNNCGGVVTPGGTCEISLVITAGDKEGVVIQELVIDYTVSGFTETDTLTSNKFSFKIEIEPAKLIFQHQPIPKDMSTNSTQILTYIVKNASKTNSITLQQVFATPASGLLIEEVATNDCGSTLAAGETCTIELTMKSGDSIGTVVQRLIIDYIDSGHNVFTLQSHIFSFSIDATRTIKFRNFCTSAVWFGVSGGAVYSKKSPAHCTLNQTCTADCDSDADCYANTKCITVSTLVKRCLSVNFAPSNGVFRLDKGESNTIHIPIPKNNVNFQDIIWNGTLAGRTGCSGTSCETSQCTSSGFAGGPCTVGEEFQAPNTTAKITMLKSGEDTYDISLIKGYNVAMSMTPSKAQSNTNPYICGAAGGITSHLGLGGCSWNFGEGPQGNPPPSNEYVHILPGSVNNCPVAGCPLGETCGVTSAHLNATAQGESPQTSCGKFIGFWSGFQACHQNPLLGAPFNCDAIADPPSPALTLTNLYLCNQGLPSCYNNGSINDTCCGCVNWQNVLIPVPDSPIVKQCVASTSTWVSNVLPTIEWIKRACPRASTYPFDNESSTFSCEQLVDNLNTVDYTVTFCPTAQ